ncbi:MAG: alpha/beta fold hydrolase [Planctomycetes bacterium]|nr:alpha/beta fold hydrolase [Planctomycetota bacterium]
MELRAGGTRRRRGSSVSTTAESETSDRARTLAAVGRLAPIRDEYPFEPRFHAVPGGRIHYVDEGPRAAPVILCVHGNPTWSFAFRRIVKAFSDRYRVVALDHLGCGLSEKPTDYEYTLENHALNLRSLVVALGLERITLVMHDWGGAIGMSFARREPRRVAGLFAMNTAAFRSRRMPLRIRVCRWPWIGPYLVREWNAFAGLAPIYGVHDRKSLSFPVKRGLMLPYETSASRRAIVEFIADIPLSSKHRSWAELKATEEALEQFRTLPVALCWGERDWCFTPAFRTEWERRFPHAVVTRCKQAGHFVFEEAPDAVESALRDLMARVP